MRERRPMSMGERWRRLTSQKIEEEEFEKALAATDGKGERAKEILYHLGSIAELQGNTEQARAFYVRIYAVDIGYRDVAEKMGAL